MKTLMILAVALFAFVGCYGGGDSTQQTAEQAVDQAKTAVDQAADYAKDKAEGAMDAVAALAPGEGETLLVGKTGCGHCTFERGESCAAAMKTATGVVYIMDGIGAGHELFEKRLDQKAISLVGTTFEKDGEKYVKVREYRM